MSEPTYTLDEARREFALRQCATSGHQWDIVSDWGAQRPRKIVCASCGWSGSVVMGERPQSKTHESPAQPSEDD